MTVDEIIAGQDAILAEAGDAALSDDQVTRYEVLEGQIAASRKTAEILTRHAAVKAAAPGQYIVAGVAAKSDDTLARAFGHYARTGKENADLVELRAQSEGTGSEGGFLVPDGFRNKLIERVKAFGGLANIVQEEVTSTGNPLNWPTVDDVANVGEIVQEGNTFSAGADIVFGTANLGAYTYATGGSGSTPVRLPVELMQDAAFDVEGLLSRLLGVRIGRIQATHLVSGTGVSQPKGLTTGLTGVGSIASTLVYSDFVNYIHGVDPAYRSASCRWVFNDNSLKTIRKILDTTGRPMLKGQDESAMSNAPGGETILGYPVVIDQGFPDIAANATTNWGAFGDLAEGYVVRRVRDIVLVVDPYGRAHNRQMQYSAWARMDATQQNTNAYVALTAHT